MDLEGVPQARKIDLEPTVDERGRPVVVIAMGDEEGRRVAWGAVSRDEALALRDVLNLFLGEL